MKIKPQNKTVTIVVLVIGIAAALLAKSMGFASTRSATRVLYSGTETRSNWSASYMLLDGTMEKSVTPRTGTLSISVETESGTIAITIRDREGTVLFQQDNIPTGTTWIEAPGKTTVRIEANQHKGSFAIDGR